MTNSNEKTFETKFLDKYPSIRQVVNKSPEFLTWKNQLPIILIDGIKFYLIGGSGSIGADQQKEEDELIYSWARKNGIVSEADIDRFASE